MSIVMNVMGVYCQKQTKPQTQVMQKAVALYLNNHVNDDEISTSPRGLGILYKTLIARKLSKPDDGRYRPKHVVFHC